MESRLELVVDSRGAERNLASLDGSLSRVEGRGNSTAAALSKLRGVVGMVAAAAGGLSFARMIRETAGFEDAMLGLQAVSGATAEQMQQLERQARTLGATSMFSAQQAGDAQRFLAMAGLEVNEVLSATPGILELAAAGQMDLARAADIASNVLGGMRLEVEELSRVNDVLAATAAGSNTSIEQLGQALSFAAPFAAAAGVEIEETAAAIGALSDAGLQGSRAGTGLVGVIRQLSRITPQAERTLAQYGLTLSDVDVETHGLTEVLERLRDANISTGHAFEIFGSEAGAAAQILATGAQRVGDFTGELKEAEGAARTAAQVIGSGLTGSMKSFGSMLSETIIHLGRDQGVAGGFQAVLDTSAGVLAVYNDLLEEFAEANDLTETQAQNLEKLAGGLEVAAKAAGLVVGARLAATLAASNAALQVKAAAAGTATLALNVLTGATTRQAAAATAMAAASRAAAGALALLGGPVGVAVMAAGALYLFRDELGLTGGESYQTTLDVDGLADAFRGLTKAQQENKRASLVGDLIEMRIEAGRLGTQLREVSDLVRNSGQLTPEGGAMPIATAEDVARGRELRQELGGLLADIGAGTSLLDEYDQAMRGLGSSTSDTNTRTRNLSDATSDSAERINTALSAFQSLRAEFDPLGHAQAEFNERVAMMDTLLAAGKIGIDDHAAAVGLLKEQLKEAREEAGGFGSELRTLRNRLQPARAAQQQMARDMNTLTLAYASGRIALEDYLQLVWRLQEAHIEASQEVEKAASYSFTTWEEVALNTVRRVDNAGQDLWLGFIDGSRNALDTVKRFFQQTLAEIAHMLTTQRLTVAVAGSLGLGGSGAAMAGDGGMDFTSLGQAAYKGYNYLTSGGGAGGWGQAISNAGSYFTGSGASVASLGVEGGISGTAITSANQIAGANTGSFMNNQWASGQGAGMINAGVGMAAGYAGNWAGGKVFGGGGYSDVGSTIGGAIGTIWGPWGTAIGSFIGSGIGSLFGGEKTPFRGEFVTREREQGWQSLSQQERRERDWYYGHHVNESALGTLGFTHSGSQRVHRAFDMDAGHDAAEWAQELANAAADMDNFLASIVDSEDDVQAMADAVQSLHIRSGNASKIIEHALVDRPLAAIEAVGLGFGERITDAIRDSASPQEAVEALMSALSLREAFKEVGGAAASDMMDHIHHVLEEGTDTLAGALEGLGTAYSALVLIDSGAERLNLQFDALAEGAIHAAWAVQDIAGGLDNLAALQSSYYAAYFSEAEQAQHALADVSAAFDELGLALPATHEGFRALVEAQDLHSEAGQRNYVALLSLSGAYDQLNRSITEQISATYQSAHGREADTESLLYWMGQVTSGTLTLEDALRSIAQTASDSAARMQAAQIQLHGSGALDSITSALAAYNGSISVANDIAQTRQQQLRDEQRAAQETQRAYQQQAQQARQAAQQMGQLLDSLLLSDQSILAPAERLAEAQRQFAALQVRAEAGDTDAAGELSGAASSYLEAAEAYFGQGSTQYAEIFRDVTGSVDDLRGDFTSAESSILRSMRAAEQTAERLARQITSSQQRVSGQHLAAQEAARSTLIDQLMTQVDTLDGIDSISALLAQLPEGIARELTGIIATDNGRGQVLPDGEYVSDSGMTSLEQQINDIYQEVLGRNADVEGLAYWVDQVVGGAGLDDVRWSMQQDRSAELGRFIEQARGDRGYLDDVGARSVYNYLQRTGGSLSDAEPHLLDGANSPAEWARRMGLPQFAEGGIATGPTSGYPVELHGTEAVIPLKTGAVPVQITGGPAAGNSELVAELRKANERLEKLEQELAAMRAERNGSAARAERQRADQLDELERGNRRNSRTRGRATV